MSLEKENASTSSSSDILQTLGADKSGHSGRSYLKWGGMTLVLLVAALVIWQMLGNGQTQSIRYKTTEVSRGLLSVTVTATGTLQPVNQVEVGSEISGTIRTVLVDFNDLVKQGQVLARMDIDQLQAKVNQARAALQLAQAQVKLSEATIVETRKNLKRSNELAKTGMCSAQDCDAAQASYDRAVADLARTNAQVIQAQAFLDSELTTLAKATIHSPINGIVLQRDVEPGQTVAASFQTPVLFTLAENLTQMELHVDVDEADVGLVREGQNAEFTVDAYTDKNFPARITEVHFASQTVDGVVTYETVLSVDNSDLLLRPGMTATADITVNKIENALLVANAALRFTPPVTNAKASKGGTSLMSQLMPRPPRSGSKSVKKLNGNNKQRSVWVLRDEQPEAIAVRVGATDGVSTEILQGDLEPGMALIVEAVTQVK